MLEKIASAAASLINMAKESKESFVDTIFDGLASIFFDTTYKVYAMILSCFTEQFSPNIGHFVGYFDADAERQLNNINSWLAVDMSLIGRPEDMSSIIRVFGFFVTLGFSIASVIFIVSIIALAFNVETKDTITQLILRFGAVFMLINFSPLVLRGAFDLTQRAWDQIAAICGNFDYTEMATSTIGSIMAGLGVDSETAEAAETTSNVATGVLAATPFGAPIMLVVVILLIVVIVQFVRFMIEIIERYLVASFLYMFFPTAAAAGVSKSTEKILKSYAQMLFTHLLLLLMNELFIFLFLKMAAALPPSLVTMFIELAFLRVASKIDSYLHALGLTTAQTGGNLMDSALGGAMMIAGLAGRIGGTARGRGAKAGIGGDDVARNGIKAADTLDGTLSQNPGATVMDAAQGMQSTGHGQGVSAAPIGDITKDDSIAKEYAGGNSRALDGLNENQQGAVLNQMMGGGEFDPNDANRVNNSLGQALGMDASKGDFISEMRPDGRGGMNFKANYVTGMDENGNPVIDSVDMHASKGSVNNQIGTAKDINGNTWNIGNSSGAGTNGGRGFGYSAIGAERNSSLSDIAARTGVTGEKIESMSGGRLSAGDFAGAQYNADTGRLELYGSNGALMGELQTDRDGNETLLENPGYTAGAGAEFTMDESGTISALGDDGDQYADYAYGPEDYDASSSGGFDESTASEAYHSGKFGQMENNQERASAMLNSVVSGDYGNISELHGQIPDEVVELGNTYFDESNPDAGRWPAGMVEFKKDGRTLAYGMRMDTTASRYRAENGEHFYKDGSTGNSLRVWNNQKNPFWNKRGHTNGKNK